MSAENVALNKWNRRSDGHIWSANIILNGERFCISANDTALDALDDDPQYVQEGNTAETRLEITRAMVGGLLRQLGVVVKTLEMWFDEERRKKLEKLAEYEFVPSVRLFDGLNQTVYPEWPWAYYVKIGGEKKTVFANNNARETAIESLTDSYRLLITENDGSFDLSSLANKWLIVRLLQNQEIANLAPNLIEILHVTQHSEEILMRALPQ